MKNSSGDVNLIAAARQIEHFSVGVGVCERRQHSAGQAQAIGSRGVGVAIRKGHAVSAARRQCTPKSLRAIDGKEKLSVCCGVEQEAAGRGLIAAG